MSVQFDNLGDLKPKVTAGGKDKTKFVPNLNVSFHDDEFYFNLNRKDKVIKNEKAATASGKTSLGGIDTDIWYIDDKGRLKWDIEFASRPAVNSWTWELKHTKSIEFYYQGELTAEEIADGCVRPDEVVGSYAVYCNKANNKYKTGKLCHIYRPFCYDAKGKTIYADLNIADGQMTISINAAWLDSASYPVRLDPTIGYASVGGSTWTRTSSSLALRRVISSAAAVTGVSSKLYIYLTSGYNNTIQLGFYSAALSLLKSGAISSGFATGWNNIDVSGETITSGNSYYPAFCCVDGTGSGGIAYDDYDGANYYEIVTSLPSTWTKTDAYDRQYSIYLEYTESGGTGNSYYYQQQQM